MLNQGKAGKEVFAPCRKMGMGGCKEHLLIAQRTSFFFFFFKQLKVKRAGRGLGLQWLTTVRSCPTFGSLNNGFLYTVVYRKLPGTTSLAKNWDKLYSSETAQLWHSSKGLLSIYLYFCNLHE